MARNTRKPSRWGKVRGWHQRPLACWDAEWLEWTKAAEAAGKPVNRWIRDWLKEAVRYDRLSDDLERFEPGGDSPQ